MGGGEAKRACLAVAHGAPLEAGAKKRGKVAPTCWSHDRRASGPEIPQKIDVSRGGTLRSSRNSEVIHAGPIGHPAQWYDMMPVLMAGYMVVLPP